MEMHSSILNFLPMPLFQIGPSCNRLHLPTLGLVAILIIAILSTTIITVVGAPLPPAPPSIPTDTHTIWNSTYGDTFCNAFPDNGNKMWLFAESPKHFGLCNQLFGVFGFAPLAVMYNASLIVGPLVSRESFSSEYHKAVWIDVPFSDFFDFEHFSNFWYKRHGLQVVDQTDYLNCWDRIKMKSE